MAVIKLILILHLALTTIANTPHKTEIIKIEGNINQSAQVIVPFDHLISATVSHEQYQSIISFSPNRFRLQSIKQSDPLPRHNRTLLQELRTPFTNEYIHIFKLGRNFFIFKMPNLFLIFKEQQSSFRLARHFLIPQLNKKDLKFQVVNVDFLLIYLSKEEAILVRSKSYDKISNFFNTTSVVFSTSSERSDECLASFNSQLYLVQATEASFQLKSQIMLASSYQLKNIKAMHIYNSVNSKIIWIVDGELGLFWIKMSHSYEIKDSPLLLLQQSGCYQFDIRQQSQIKILLTCASNGQSFFIKSIYLYQNHKPILIKQWSPHLESCKTKRFIFYKEHIFSLEKQSVDVFLPSIYKGQKELFYLKNWISLVGHSAYWIHRQQDEQLFLYSVNNFTLTKAQLIMEEYSLQIKSDREIHAKFNLTVEYMCSGSTSKVREICIYDTQIEVNLHSKNLSFIQFRSINIAIILVIITSIAAIAFICYSKYQTLQYNALLDLKSITNPKNFKL